MSKRISLSYPINNQTPLYGGAKNIKIEVVRSLELGDTSNNLYLQFPNHCSTHIDFPSHFCEDGNTLTDYSPDYWEFNNIGFAESDLSDVEDNSKSLINDDIELLIIKTGFGKFRGKRKYWEEQPAIEPKLADTLRKRFPKLRILGFDMISLSSWQYREKGREAHKSFLCKNDILILEDMNLTNLNETPQKVFVAPLLIENADGAPCNVIAYV